MTQLALFDRCQRWNRGRDSYRPAGEPLRTADYDVAPILDDSTARRFVVEHHYSSTYPAARWRFGLHHRGELVGVAVFSVPVNERTLTSVFDVASDEAVELGRFVLRDEVPANGETWFLGRCFRALRSEGLAGVVSFSDPVARTTAQGCTVFGGHLGVIYQAHNALYLGRGAPQTLRLLPDGSVLSNRAQNKVRHRERGWRYASAQLEAFGASPLGEDDDARVWLARWRGALTRAVRHPGNHKYAWPLHRRALRSEVCAQPYPKVLA